MQGLSTEMQGESRKLREKKSELALYQSGTPEKPYIASYARIKPKLPFSKRLAEAVQTKERNFEAGKLITDFQIAFTKLGEKQVIDEITHITKNRIEIFLKYIDKLNYLIINTISMDITFKTSYPITKDIKILGSYSLIFFLSTIASNIYNQYLCSNR